MHSLPPESHTCAICGRPLDVYLAGPDRAVEARIALALRRLHPQWQPDEGACPECVQAAVQVLRRARSADSLHAELNLSYPVYARDETHLIPAAARVHANPRYTGRGVTIAFLDSGFYPHPDLVEPRSRIRAHVDATLAEPVENPNFRRPEPSSWHGLMVSSVAAGNGWLSGGVYRGIATEADLVLVKTGNRRNRRIPDRDIERALRWVLDHHAEYGIRVLNISLGGDHPSTGEAQPLDTLVEEAVARGIVVVVAAGNGGVNQIIPPASAPAAITVGGLDDQNTLDPRYRRMWRSSWGQGVGGVFKPDLVAPAIWVAAPMLPRTWVHNEAQLLWRLAQANDAELERFLRTRRSRLRFLAGAQGATVDEARQAIRRRIVQQKYIHPHYQHVDGTSMAAPLVSAVVAQMLEANPNLTPAQVKALLLETAVPMPHVPRQEQGAGALEAARAVAAALRAPGGRLAGLPISPTLDGDEAVFICAPESGRQAALVASFNGWQAGPGRMCEARPGVWVARVPRPPPGEHAYKFLVDGRHWVHDVENPNQIEDGYGGFHSLLAVPGGSAQG